MLFVIASCAAGIGYSNPRLPKLLQRYHFRPCPFAAGERCPRAPQLKLLGNRSVVFGFLGYHWGRFRGNWIRRLGKMDRSSLHLPFNPVPAALSALVFRSGSAT